MLHDKRNKLCQRNYVFTDVVTTEDFVMKQVVDKLVVLVYIYLYLFLNVYGIWEISSSGYTNDIAHTELVCLHICMNDVCDKLKRAFPVNKLIF